MELMKAPKSPSIWIYALNRISSMEDIVCDRRETVCLINILMNLTRRRGNRS